MSQRDPGVYLEDIEHYATAAIRFTTGLSLQQYLADEKTRAAVERVLEICGEAMNQLYRVAPGIAKKSLTRATSLAFVTSLRMAMLSSTITRSTTSRSSTPPRCYARYGMH